MKHTAIERMKAIGVVAPDILIPNPSVDLYKWAVVACDQYTSERSYWERVAKLVQDAPSTLRLIFPEVYLEDPNRQERIDQINATMHEYLDNHMFDTYSESFFLVQRITHDGKHRWGLMAALDLEAYDYRVDSTSLIRATEGTIVSRIPPRKQIRKDAPLELPHILVLINDPQGQLIERLAASCNTFPLVYDTPLMEQGGQVRAYQISQEALDQVADAFEQLVAAVDPKNPLVFAMGDGNHSLATAKSCWEDIKQELTPEQQENHPSRYALVELENIFDAGLVFEPIHRVLFSCSREAFFTTLERYCDHYTLETINDLTNLEDKIVSSDGIQRFGYTDATGTLIVSVTNPASSIAAGTLQSVIDDLTQSDQKIAVDYTHGDQVTAKLGSEQGNIGLFLPAIDKHSFFDSIIADGALPRKTFSMGEAHEKRFYLEARKIK
jgi:hypothetical protein